MSKLSFVYVVFRSPENKPKYGEMKRFDNAHNEAKEKGYPDVMTYLYATGQIEGWCELATDEEALMYERAK